MAKGRPPDPGRARRGTGHRPQAGRGKVLDVLPAEVDLTPPAELPPGAAELWRRAAAELAPRGLNTGDLPLVEMLVVAAYRHRQARAFIDQIGLLVESKKRGPILNPLLKVEKETAATYLRLAETLGLSPAARVRLGLMEIAGQSILLTIAEQVRRAQR